VPKFITNTTHHSKLADRVENAKKTLYVTENVPWQRVLLIDDAVGSGATLNEVAHKLKSQFATTFVAGFAIVGSYKGTVMTLETSLTASS